MDRRSFLAGATGAAVSLPALPAAAQQTAPIVLRVGSVPVESYAEVYYAQELGFFKQAGLDVRITSFSGGGAITAGVVSGSLDIGATNCGSASAAHVRGLPVALIAPGGIYTSSSPTTVLAVAKNSAIRSAKELVGKTVAVSTLRDLQQIAAMAWIDKNGGDSKKVQWVEMPVPEMAPSLTAGRVQGAMILEPSLTQAKNEIRILGKAYDALSPRLMITAWFSTKSWLEKNPEIARRFAAVMLQTANWANHNPKGVAEILGKYTKIPPAVLGEMNHVAYTDSLDPALIQPTIDGLAHYGVLSHAFPASELFWTR